MCAIIGSFSKLKFKELYDLNAYRGSLSYSFTRLDYDNDETLDMGPLHQGEGVLPNDIVERQLEYYNRYYVGHSQAPTTQSKNIHPARYNGAFLWHNGIIKQKHLDDGQWDTEWLLQHISDYGWSILSQVDGTFACLMYMDNKLYTFRNEISPLFYDSELNISSTKFEGSEPVPPNVVFMLDMITKKLIPVSEFKTFENPYYFAE